MAKEAKKDNKNMIIGSICAVIVVVVVIIVAVVLVTRNGGINDDYFKSDGTKYVLTIDSESVGETAENTYNPVKTHIVYTYSGDQITGMKTYGEFKDNDAAKKAFDAIKEAGEDMTNYVVDGKYIIVTATEDQYKNLTTNDVKAQIEFMESLKNSNNSNAGGEVKPTETTETETTNKE